MYAQYRWPCTHKRERVAALACALELFLLVPGAVLLGGCGAPAAIPTGTAVPTVRPSPTGAAVPTATAVPTVAATPMSPAVPSPLTSPAADACGAATLARFKQIVNRPSTDVPLYLVTERLMAEVPSLLGTDFSNVIWIIAARGTTACVVTMTALTGGVQIKGPAFAVDLSTGLVTADNYDARTVFATGPYTNVRLPQGEGDPETCYPVRFGRSISWRPSYATCEVQEVKLSNSPQGKFGLPVQWSANAQCPDNAQKAQCSHRQGFHSRFITFMSPNNNDTEKRLWDAADELRANSGLKSLEYSVPVLGLICLQNADHRVALRWEDISGTWQWRREDS